MGKLHEKLDGLYFSPRSNSVVQWRWKGWAWIWSLNDEQKCIQLVTIADRKYHLRVDGENGGIGE